MCCVSFTGDEHLAHVLIGQEFSRNDMRSLVLRKGESDGVSLQTRQHPLTNCLPGARLGSSRWRYCWLSCLLALGLFSANACYADDRHAGYYYPEPLSSEVYRSEVPGIPGANRERRIGFIVTIINAMFERPYPPRIAIFAKGADAEKLLIVALENGLLDTIYRARAHLAMLTSLARGTPIFKRVGAADLNFFDLLKMLGFRQLTISDGVAFSHQVKVE